LDLAGNSGIAHTRWATHGEVSERNAHPHTIDNGLVTIVHNGIVENYLDLKRELIQRGHAFASDTDSEVIAHLLADELREGTSLENALRSAMSRTQGAAAVVAMSTREPGTIAAARIGNAGGIVIGLMENGHAVASDIIALLPHTRKVAYLESGQIVRVTSDHLSVSGPAGRPVDPKIITTSRSHATAGKGQFRHYMAKEIAEQPEVVTAAMRQRVDFTEKTIDLPELDLSAAEADAVQRAVFIGMGTSLHAAMTGAQAMESLARVPSVAENASEIRYRNAVLDENCLVVAVTQSGETADTLAAMEYAKECGARLVAVVEAEGTQATRLADFTLPIRSGQEIGVAATKTMTATMVTLLLLSVEIAKARRKLDRSEESRLVEALAALPALAGQTLEQDGKIENLATEISGYHHLLYLGRGEGFPVAMEGALKRKEVAYIHAEGYAAGEMKHGVNALISDEMPTVAVAPHDSMFDKMAANVNEVKSRGGRVIALTTAGDDVMESLADDVLYVPTTHPLLQPVLNVIPLQQLAYHTALAVGSDPDKPRNLAKTVTVE
jgi:glucosamine--fructose-6-phosphate aminotransferase (isomerizing)